MMQTESIYIRSATTQDAKSLLEIYAYYVKHTAITFEYQVPSLEEFTHRISTTLKKFPYLVAESSFDHTIVGYAYASPFHTREAYQWSVEVSIYVNHEFQHMGLGRQLYDTLEQLLKAQNILNLNACIAYPTVEDEYLTQNSLHFHEHLGYHLVGKFSQCGYKFNRWCDMVWMEKHIGAHTIPPSSVKSFAQVKDLLLPEP